MDLNVPTTLPPAVLAMLAPVVEAVTAQTVAATRAARLATLIDQRERYSERGYDVPVHALTAAVYAGQAPPPGVVDWDDEDADEQSTEHEDCDCEDCEPECEAWDSCCGWCSDHRRHCGEGQDDSGTDVCPCGCGYCRDCDHHCDRV